MVKNITVEHALDDTRIKAIRPLVPPQIAIEEFPLSAQAADTVLAGRSQVDAIVTGEDDRLLVIVGPCSIHDVAAGLEYAKKLKEYAVEAEDELCIVMRVYLEKPRTTVGWKGLINDPFLDGSYQINKGLRLARESLVAIAKMGLFAGTEFLDTISPQYTADLISWGAIGARTTESQLHRQLASGLSMSIGFKNGTDGSIGKALDAIKCANSSHVFLSVTKQGISAIVETQGNDMCHIILRGSDSGQNYSPEHVAKAAAELKEAGLDRKIMIDCSHGNSQKKHENQLKVVESIREQLSQGNNNIMGCMLESNLVEGKQSIAPLGPANLVRGRSVTDACISWDTTVAALQILRDGVTKRRQANEI